MKMENNKLEAKIFPPEELKNPKSYLAGFKKLKQILVKNSNKIII